MPDIPTGSQIFDVAFHPTAPLVFAGLLSGRVKAFSYDDDGEYEEKFTLRPSKRSCRALALSEDGARLYASGKSKAFHIIDVTTGKVAETREAIHGAPVNRIERLTHTLFCTGDDDGVVKLWDSRKPEPVKEYTHHFDYITDFLSMEEKRQVIVTSGDGSLSVLDFRASKKAPLAHSEDQEDELLSLVRIQNKGTTKVIVGTQLGVLSVFDPAKGWRDCVDRIVGHPQSIDALAPLPPSYLTGASTILTGSSDGIVRLVELYPQKPAAAIKLLGQVVDHGEFPVEVIRVDGVKDGDGDHKGKARWIASAGHDEMLKLTDLRSVLEDEDGDQEGDQEGERGGSEGVDKDEEEDETVGDGQGSGDEEESVEGASPEFAAQDGEDDSNSEDEQPKPSQKRKRELDPLATAAKSKKRKGRGELVDDPSFYSGL